MVYDFNSTEYSLSLLGNEANNPTFLEDAYVEILRSIWPRRCYNTRKILWLSPAVRARRFCRLGDNNFINEDRWFDTKEFTLMKLKGY